MQKKNILAFGLKELSNEPLEIRRHAKFYTQCMKCELYMKDVTNTGRMRRYEVVSEKLNLDRLCT